MEAHAAASAAAEGLSADDGAVADDVFAWLLMDDDGSGGELLNLLDVMDDDGSGGELLNLLDEMKDEVVEPVSTVGRVRFIDDPYSSLLVFQSSSSYITINGNEESCGSSFSDSCTSVMASVDTNGLRRKLAGGSVEAPGEQRSASGSRNDETREDGSVIVCDEFDCEWDDEVLARFLGGEEGGFSENR